MRVEISDEGLQFCEIVVLEYLAGNAEGDIGKVRHDGCSGLDEDVVAFDPTDVSHSSDDEFGGSPRGPSIPTGEIEAVVDGLDPSGIDSVDFDAVLTDLF